MKPKQATAFVMDLVSALETEKKSGSYISNIVKAIRSWLDFNGIQLQQKIRISNRDDLTKFADERPPTPDELCQILNAALHERSRLRVQRSDILVFPGHSIWTYGA